MPQQPPSDADTNPQKLGADDVDTTSKHKRHKPKVSVMRILAIVVATYAVICVLVYLFQARLIYFPARGYEASPADVGLDYEAVRLKTADGVSLSAWYIEHPDAAGSAIFCHGNAGNISHRLNTIKLLHLMGVNVLIFDYRGYGESEGSPGEQGLYRDAEAAWRHLIETRGESPDRVVLFGRSLGGAVAIELARRHTPGALVVESTFTSLVEVARAHYGFLPVGLLLRQRYESVKKVPDIRCPKLFFHGRDDALIPLKIGKRLFDAAAKPKRFIETPGGHNDGGFLYSDRYAGELAAFLKEVLTD